MNAKIMLISGVLALACSGAFAQSAEVLVQGVINAKGKSCPAVSQIKGIGQSSNGDALLAVACSDGGHHVVSVNDRREIRYSSECWVFTNTTGVKCF